MMNLPDILMHRAQLMKTNLLLKIGFVLAIITIILLVFFSTFKQNIGKLGADEYIGLLKIENIIMDDQKFDKLLDEISRSKQIKGLVLQINSPGGSSGASEKIYHKLVSIGAKIPVVASLGSVAASGGYLVALAGHKIFAMNMTITGSIGVLFQNTEIVDAAEKLGVKFKSYKSSPLKAAPNPTEVATPEVEQATMEIIQDSHDYFTQLVAKSRKLDIEKAKILSDGRIYTGRQALGKNLIDEIGTLENAIEWLKTEHKLSSDIEVREMKPKKRSAVVDAFLDSIEEEMKLLYSKLINSLASMQLPMTIQ